MTVLGIECRPILWFLCFRMGLQHDGVGNDCDDDPEDGKIMASLVQASYEEYYWTTCSKERLARYIE